MNFLKFYDTGHLALKVQIKCQVDVILLWGGYKEVGCIVTEPFMGLGFFKLNK